MVRSAGVHEPQRPFWLVTQRTLAGTAIRPCSGRYRSISRRARSSSSSSERPDALLAGGQPGEHPVDPLALLGPGELVGDEHDDPLAVAIGGHRPAPALTAPYFDDRLARHGHYRLAQPGFRFTKEN